MVKLAMHAALSKAGKPVLNKAGKPVKKPFAKKVAENKRFRTVHKVSYSGGTDADPQTATVRGVEQVSYQDIVAMTQKTAKSFLIKHGVLAEKRTPHREKFVCWNCGVVMTPQRDNVLRCQATHCKVRSRVIDPHLAFSPFFNTAASGQDINYTVFLRTCYCLGIKAANDQALHLARQKGQSAAAAKDMVYKCYRKHRVALAFAEKTHAQEATFEDDVVEVDTGRTSGKTVGSSRLHQGRLLAIKGRLKKTWAVHSLATKVSDGKRGSPPEPRPR